MKTKYFDIVEAVKLLNSYGIPDPNILVIIFFFTTIVTHYNSKEYFLAIMLNKNQFQDLQRYCDQLENNRREKLQANPDRLSPKGPIVIGY